MELNIFIIGLGLMGGSLGMALKNSALVTMITGFDVNAESGAKALELGAADKIAQSLSEVRAADVIFISTPLSTYPSILDEIRPWLKEDVIVTDMGSTKGEVISLFQSLSLQTVAIGGHPMTGSEGRGITAADRYLFENAVYVLTPFAETSSSRLETLTRLLKETGAQIKIMTAEQHDEIVATISHIPHLAAAALVSLTGGREDHLMLAAGGFRDTTRIASSDPALWRDILEFNRGPLVQKLEQIISALQNYKTALAEKDMDYIYDELWSAKQIRDSIPNTRKGLMPGHADFVCIVPDKPGIIGQLGSILSYSDINISDIEILRVREGDGGTIRIGVPDQGKAQAAIKVLQTLGINAWQR